MSKDLFLKMREQDLATMYDATFTKKDCIKQGESIVNNVVDNGNVGSIELLTNLIRLEMVISTAVTKLRGLIPFEKVTLNGVEFSPTNGGNSINYLEDEIYATLKRDLDARTEQLKMAQKQDTFDAYGNQVPKLSTTPRKDSISLKF